MPQSVSLQKGKVYRQTIDELKQGPQTVRAMFKLSQRLRETEYNIGYLNGLLRRCGIGWKGRKARQYVRALNEAEEKRNAIADYLSVAHWATLLEQEKREDAPR